MTTKLIFTCNACSASGVIKLNSTDGEDLHEINVCPSCGNVLEQSTDEYEDE